MNPARSPGLWQSQASQEPPTLFPRGERRKFLPLRRHGLPGDWQRPPPAQGCAWGRGSILRLTLTPLFTCKHLLRAYYVPRFSSPQGAATKTLPNLKSQLGGPQEEDGRAQTNSWPGQRRLEDDPPWEKWQASSIFSEHRLAPLALPHIPGVGEEENKDSDSFSSFLAVLFHLTSATGHRAAPRPSHFTGVRAHPSHQSLWGTLGPVMKVRPLQRPPSPIQSIPVLPHTCSSFLPA